MFRLLVYPYIRRYEQNSLEKVLKRARAVLDEQGSEELCRFISRSQPSRGGFCDRAGRPDLYYSLFGFWLAGAFDLQNLYPGLSEYLKNECHKHPPEGVHAHCASILAAGLERSGHLRQGDLPSLRIRRVETGDGQKKEVGQGAAHQYGHFMQLISAHAQKDYRSLFRLQREWRSSLSSDDVPGPVIAASLVLRHVLGKGSGDLDKRLMSFYDGKGGFRASRHTALSDLLSTGVALYALRSSGTSLHEIAPDCLRYVDSLYSEGGFCGNTLDPDPDLEYTFYGLLALGALSN